MKSNDKNNNVNSHAMTDMPSFSSVISSAFKCEPPPPSLPQQQQQPFPFHSFSSPSILSHPLPSTTSSERSQKPLGIKRPFSQPPSPPTVNPAPVREVSGAVFKRARCCGGWCLCPDGLCECDQKQFPHGRCCWKKKEAVDSGGGGRDGDGDGHWDWMDEDSVGKGVRKSCSGGTDRGKGYGSGGVWDGGRRGKIDVLGVADDDRNSKYGCSCCGDGTSVGNAVSTYADNMDGDIQDGENEEGVPKKQQGSADIQDGMPPLLLASGQGSYGGSTVKADGDGGLSTCGVDENRRGRASNDGSSTPTNNTSSSLVEQQDSIRGLIHGSEKSSLGMNGVKNEKEASKSGCCEFNDLLLSSLAEEDFCSTVKGRNGSGGVLNDPRMRSGSGETKEPHRSAARLAAGDGSRGMVDVQDIPDGSEKGCSNRKYVQNPQNVTPSFAKRQVAGDSMRLQVDPEACLLGSLDGLDGKGKRRDTHGTSSGASKSFLISLVDALPPLTSSALAPQTSISSLEGIEVESYGSKEKRRELSPEDFCPLPAAEDTTGFSVGVMSSLADAGTRDENGTTTANGRGAKEDELDAEDAAVGNVVPLYRSDCCGGLCRCGPGPCACSPNADPPGSCCWGPRTSAVADAVANGVPVDFRRKPCDSGGKNTCCSDSGDNKHVDEVVSETGNVRNVVHVMLKGRGRNEITDVPTKIVENDLVTERGDSDNDNLNDGLRRRKNEEVEFSLGDLFHLTTTEASAGDEVVRREQGKEDDKDDNKVISTQNGWEEGQSDSRDEVAIAAVAAKGIMSETQCIVCKMEFESAKALSQHLRVNHAGERVYPCGVCGKRFLFKQNRDRHLSEVHMSRRLFPCPEEGCLASFKNNGGLKHHRRTVHRKERPHRCTICERGFGQRNHLTQHVATVHFKKRPFRCEDCGHAFSNRGNLNQHLRRRHPERTVEFVLGPLGRKERYEDD